MTYFDLPTSAVPAQLGPGQGAHHTCSKTESIFSTAIPYKDMHDVMNDVFFVYRVKLYEQELEH